MPGLNGAPIAQEWIVLPHGLMYFEWGDGSVVFTNDGESWTRSELPMAPADREAYSRMSPWIRDGEGLVAPMTVGGWEGPGYRAVFVDPA